MTRFRPLMLASMFASLPMMVPASAGPGGVLLAQAQPGVIVPQSADGSKAPPPAEAQPGAVVGSAADAPAVAAQADGQPVITPGQDQQPSPAQAPPVPAAGGPIKPPSNTLEMPESPTPRTPEPSTLR